MEEKLLAQANLILADIVRATPGQQYTGSLNEEALLAQAVQITNDILVRLHA